MLHEIIQLRIACNRARGVEVGRASYELARWKRHSIANNLYGVDIKPEAIEIAKLRLWLSLIVDLDLDQVEPLPNLDYKIVVGNSLIETINGHEIIPKQSKLVPTIAEAEYDKLTALRQKYFEATHEERRLLKRDIERQESRILLSSIEEQEDTLRETIQHVSAKSNRDRSNAESDLRFLEKLKKSLEKGEGVQKPLIFAMTFPEVFVETEKPGFDIVIANPPYVNTKVEIEYEASLLKEYGFKDDLYVHFYFKSLELLREKGFLAFISSDTFLTTNTKLRLRELMQLNRLFALITCYPFQQTIDAAIVIMMKDRTQNEDYKFEFASARGEDEEVFTGMTNPFKAISEGQVF